MCETCKPYNGERKHEICFEQDCPCFADGKSQGHYDGYGDALEYEKSQVSRVIEILADLHVKAISANEALTKISEALYFVGDEPIPYELTDENGPW